MQSTSDPLHGNAQARANGDAAELPSSPPVEPSSSDATIRFQAQLLNMVEQAVIATDLTGRITFWNRFAETLYGWMAEEVLGRDVLEITVAPAAQELPLTREQSTALFRIVQETLTNVARHAGATRVNVTLEVDHRGLTLEVQDNGRGIGTSEVVGTRSLGLVGMRERAELLGGAFQIRGVPGAGTTVRVWLPLTAEHHWNGT